MTTIAAPTSSQHHEAFRAYLVDWLDHYPEDIFTPPPPLETERDKLLSTVVAAHMARHVLTRLIEVLDAGAYIDEDNLPIRGRARLSSPTLDDAHSEEDTPRPTCFDRINAMRDAPRIEVGSEAETRAEIEAEFDAALAGLVSSS